MDVTDALAKINQLQRERDALDGSYADLMKELADRPNSCEQALDKETLALIAQLVNYIEMERSQSATLSGLLADSYGFPDLATRTSAPPQSPPSPTAPQSSDTPPPSSLNPKE